MGYTTEFSGQIEVSPPLTVQEIEFLKKFSETRRMNRKNGPYYVDGKGFLGQGHEEDVISFNTPPAGQPGLWCQWVPTDDGHFIEWDGGEKFYESAEWMKYIINYFLKPGAIASSKLSFLQGHICNGEIEAQGEQSSDRWMLIVKDNVVQVADSFEVTYKPPRDL